MNPQSPAIQTSNIPSQVPTAPSVAPIAQPTSSAPNDSLMNFAGSLAQASSDRFSKLATSMQSAGYIYNPQSGTFVQNQAFLNPLQQEQMYTQYNPQGMAQQAQNQASATASAAADQVVNPTELDNFVNAQGQTPDNPNMTLGQLQQQGYVYLSSSDKQAVDAINQGQSLLSQIANASKSVNTTSGGTLSTNGSNFLQMLKGGFEDLIGDTAAKNLSENLPAQLNTIVQALGGSQRFNPSQIEALDKALPDVGDTVQQAAVKMQDFQVTLNNLKGELLPQVGLSPTTNTNQSQLGSDFSGGK